VEFPPSQLSCQVSSDRATPFSQVLADARDLVSGTTTTAAGLWTSALASASTNSSSASWLAQLAAGAAAGTSQDLQCVLVDAGMVRGLYGDGRSPQLLLGMLAAYLAAAHLCTYGALLLATRHAKHAMAACEPHAQAAHRPAALG
jgi:hypothetical protein